MSGFYSGSPQDCLLLGDIVTGFRAVVPHIHDPGQSDGELGITVSQPEYFAVATPCCSVGGGRISLAPLIHIDPQWMINPYLAEDLTRINSKASGENFWPPKQREKASSDEVQAMAERGPIYGFNDRFVYAPHDLLRIYQLKNLPSPTAHWLLDFGLAFRIECKKISRDFAPASLKILELSVETRHELRKKMEEYYGRIPDEDREALGALI